MMTAAYRVYSAMRDNKSDVRKGDVQKQMDMDAETFDNAWKSLRSNKRVLRTRSKRYVLNGTTLAATMQLNNQLV